MRRASPFLPILLASALLYGGCEDVIGIDVPRSKPALAVYGFFNPDSTWRVAVYRTVHPDEHVSPGEAAIEDARVSITGETGTDTLVHAGRGIYLYRGGRPSAGSEYTVKIDAPQFPSASAVDVVPSRPVINVRAERGEEHEFFVRYRLTIELHDPPGPNWYRLALYRRLENDAWAPGFFSSVEPFLRSSPATVGGVDIEQTPEVFDVAYFDDATFDGEVVEMLLRTDVQRPVGNIYAVLTSMSETYFEYHRSLDLQRRNEGDPLSDPVSVRSNVVGGVGTFGAYSNTTQQVRSN